MIHRIKLSMAFDDIDPANDILEEARRHKAQCVPINPQELNEEVNFITVEQCYHDTDPTLPCVVLIDEQF